MNFKGHRKFSELKRAFAQVSDTEMDLADFKNCSMLILFAQFILFYEDNSKKFSILIAAWVKASESDKEPAEDKLKFYQEMDTIYNYITQSRIANHLILTDLQDKLYSKIQSESKLQYCKLDWNIAKGKITVMSEEWEDAPNTSRQVLEETIRVLDIEFSTRIIQLFKQIPEYIN